MKTIRYAAIAALISTSFTPLSLTTGPAAAAVPTTADMEAVCATYDTDGSGTNYQVVTTAGAEVQGTPTGDPSTIVNDESTRVANHSTASSPWGTIQYFGNAGRHGGSVNLFAQSGYPGITYAGSLVDQNWDLFQTDTYNFSCQVQHWEIVGYHSETVPGTPVQGYYINWDWGHGQGTDNGTGGDPNAPPQGSCEAHNNTGPSWAQWGEDTEQCKFIVTAPAVPESTIQVPDYDFVNSGAAIERSLTNGPYYVETVLYASGVAQAVPVTETDNAPYFAGDGVVCINPGKKGGTWTAKAGWTHPEQCTTAYFTTAPYISGANVFSSNSLPAQ